MFRLFYIIIILILPLQSIASDSYTVRIAVYNNIDSLKQELKKLSPAVRKTIEIQKRGEQHVASSIHTKDKTKLQKLLPSYKKVFPDAFISTYEPIEINTTQTNSVKKTEANKVIAQTTMTKTVETTEVKEVPSVMKRKKNLYSL